MLIALAWTFTAPSARAAPPDDLSLSILGRFALDCPVCRQAFTSLTCTQSNTRAGIDRDLFPRALGPQPEFYRISTCPKCGYSGYPTDFDAEVKLPADFIDKVRRHPRLTLPAGFAPESDPRELDASVRYALAVTCYEWRGRSDEALAWLNLRASWIAREEGSALTQDPRLVRVMRYIERWRPPLEPGGNQLDVEMQLTTRMGEALSVGEFNRYQRPYVELAWALILRRHGENLQAVPVLDRLLETGAFAEPLLGAIQRMRASVDTERGLQMKALEHFERAVRANQIGPANRGAALYLLGELSRRLGRDAQAVGWFDRALAVEGLDPKLAGWARLQRSVSPVR